MDFYLYLLYRFGCCCFSFSFLLLNLSFGRTLMKPGNQVRIQSQGATMLRGHSNGRSFGVKLPGCFISLEAHI